LLDLNKKVFGKITTKEIIGAIPPAIPDIKNLLENEFHYLIKKLNLQTKEDLKKILAEQLSIDSYMNSRPGAMALAQDKIRLFTKYNQKYIQTINNKIKS